MRQWLEEKGVSAEKIFVPQNVHDFGLFRPDADVKKKFDFVYCGLLAPYKRIDLMLDSLALVQKKRPGTSLLLIGDGPQRESLECQAYELGIAKQVHFCGKQDFHKLPQLLNQARVFIMTSQGEGLPMAMIEAMSCGLPVIVPADADIEEVAKHEENGLVVAGHTASQFAEAIMRLINHPEIYERLQGGALALRNSKWDEYSLEYQTALWGNAVNLLLGLQPPAPKWCCK